MARRKVIRVRIKGKLMTLREVSEKYHISQNFLDIDTNIKCAAMNCVWKKGLKI